MTRRLSRTGVIAALIGAVLVFYIVDRAVEHVRQGLADKTNLDDLLPTFWSSLKAQWFHISTAKPALIGGLAAVGVLALCILYSLTTRKITRPGEEQGSAKWARSGSQTAKMRGSKGTQIRLTATESLSTDSYKTKRNLNVLVVGGSGAGKTRSYVLPNLKQLNASFAITDPKKEIQRAVRQELERRGYKTRVLDLIDLAQSMSFNPMRYFNPAEPETGVAQLVECIIANTSGKKPAGGTDQFWERAERALLTALVAYVWATTVADDQGEPNLPGVLSVQQGMGGSEENKDERDSETDIKFQAARQVVEEWHNNPNSEDDPQVMKVLDYACRQYAVYEQGPVETRMSVVISLGVRLAPLDMHDVREILKTDTIALDKLGYEKTAIFLAIPDTHMTFQFVAAMFWQTLFEHSIYQADHEPDGRLPELVHYMLDEFPNLGMIPGFERKMATIRSRNISASVIVQDYSQGKALFRDEWNSIVANCNTKLFLGGDDPETTKWVSSLLGDETIVPNETSRTYGMNGSYSRSQRVMKRPLMDPSEVGRLDDDECILMIRGLDPYKSRKIGR